MFARRLMVSNFGLGARSFSTSGTAFEAVRAAAKARAGVLLQRDPIVIERVEGFEAEADKYFQWLEYVSAEKFPREFFFKKGSSAETKWMELEDQRESEWYFSPETKPESKSLKNETVGGESGEAKEINKAVEIHPRVTKADESGDVKSLERKLDRTLYLLVKDSKGQWVFPQGALEGEEVLHDAARRNLKDICGKDMSVWTVGYGPVGHHEASDHTTFFIKGHILGGQAKPNNTLASDFKWATKEEIESAVSSEYWQSVNPMLSTV
ncbi:hypothetical protein BX070DRAFT_218231 [Coemansia spiralis]|nr:hypothetical protein BX070DRAFT_218231 [Coemansia spiralis]